MEDSLKQEIIALIKQVMADGEAKEESSEKEAPQNMEELKAKRDEVLDTKEE